MKKTIKIPSEYSRLFDDDWREAGIFGGRFCFSGDTLISKKKFLDRIDNVKVGDLVLTKEGVFDKITSVDCFEKDYDPKPMLQIEINGYITNTTYDHKYFNGKTYVPIYQLVWGIMDECQRRTLELLCKQYGENTNNELQRWLQNRDIETSNKQKWLSYNCCWKENTINTQINSKNIYTKHTEQRNSKPQERNKNRQQDRKFRMGNEERTITTSLENRIKERPTNTRKQSKENNRKRGERITSIQVRKSENAYKNDGEDIGKELLYELRWDKRFAEWKNLEISTGGISSQKTNFLGSKKLWIKVIKVNKSEKVWSITTEKYHNYFANGVNVSNSLKSHTVARMLLIKAREKKTRVACFREFQSSIAESSHQLLSELIAKYDLVDFKVTNNSIVNTINESDFIFKGLWNNEQSIKSIEGIDIAWVEEAQTVSQKSLEVLTPTVRKDNSKIIYTYNRLLEDDPVHQRLVVEGRPNTLIINCNYDIAIKYGWIPEVILKEIEDDKIFRPALYKHKWLGEPSNLERRIFKDWKIIDEIPHEARLEKRWLDFGYTNDPSAIGDVYYYNGGWILDEQLYQKGMSNKQLADFLNTLDKKHITVVADSAEPKSIDEIRSYGINIVGVTKGKDSVMNQIQLVQDQPISYTRRSVNIHKEYIAYLFKEDKNGRILNEEDTTCENHHMAGIRYALSTLGRLKQEVNYWDRVFDNELNLKNKPQISNRGR